eukprot:CAMPEP_0197234920 /NCGR_PEP_ID=MMETSP1429-20130617/2516_1 /TAXON_ID=49237 /ORGANISM="Chaetoceros  sp., Strain UNC1202" /LENGTH=209 /DNA_ID=CAMNT_0042693423 /DNA_START=49 /DNA_END=678 /DNA_ORIENTATION=+
MSTIEPRKLDELEGSLLDPNNVNNSVLPIAHAINPEEEINLVQAIPVRGPNPGNHAATPVDYFEYGDNVAEDAAIPTAPALNQYNDDSPEAKEHAVARKARLGSDIGRINAIEEKDKVRAVDRQAKAQPYFEKQRIQAAREIAKRRVKEGFDVKNSDFSERGLGTGKQVQKQDAKFIKKGGSYEVADYDVANYNGSEYNAEYEYKSVYD